MIPSPIDLITVKNVTDWLSPTKPGAGEASLLQMLVTSASVYWLQRTGRGPISGAIPTQSPFVQSVNYTETYDGNGNSKLYLRNWPIAAVSSLIIGNQTIPASPSFGQWGYVIDGSARAIALQGGWGRMPSGVLTVGFYNLQTAWPGKGPVFSYGVQNVQIQYTGGFAAQPITNELQTIDAAADPITTYNRWVGDLGVKYFTGGAALTRVYVAPSAGQYFINTLGQYVFSVADAGQQVLINYDAAGTPFDIIEKCTEMVGLTYKRRGWIDEKQHLTSGLSGGSTVYRDWEFPPGIDRVFEFYARRSRAA